MRARDQSSIFSNGGKFRPDYGLLLELHTLTLVARSYALLVYRNGLRGKRQRKVERQAEEEAGWKMSLAGREWSGNTVEDG